ncbi:MAG: transcriptional repressor LexA [Oscillospiraceae bacterium]|nr:transcriptional repressor LexA [Oscillospiraceae bacterium]
MKPLSARQEQILKFIKEYTREMGYPPAVREICEGVGLSSPASVHAQLNTLQKRGYLNRAGSKTRSLTFPGDPVPTMKNVPILGRVAAGVPILATEDVEGYVPFDAGKSQKELFALRVKGDSMINAGILPNDVIIVEQQETATNGEIVVALIEDEATVKRLNRSGSSVLLMPENPAYSPIDGRNAKILGRVLASVRYY